MNSLQSLMRPKFQAPVPSFQNSVLLTKLQVFECQPRTLREVDRDQR